MRLNGSVKLMEATWISPATNKPVTATHFGSFLSCQQAKKGHKYYGKSYQAMLNDVRSNAILVS